METLDKYYILLLSINISKLLLKIGVDNMKQKIVITLAIALAIFISSIACFFIQYSKTSNLKDIYFSLDKDSTIEQIALELEKKSVIKSESYLRYYAKAAGFKDNVKSGNYILKPQMKFNDVLTKLQSGKSDFYSITVPEGYTLHQIASKLEKNNLAKKNSFISSNLEDIDTEAFISGEKDVFYDLEGYLLPDTYYIPVNFTEEDIIKLMFNNFKSAFSEKDILRSRELGLSINEITTIASLIEKEAANDKERSIIAGVIYNRIKKGMALQIDAAVIYANTKGEKNLDKVYYNHLKVESKYNTYLYKGLPPGPIASPGRASIEAALYPENNEYLYYVAAEKGHVFSKTYEEHVVNVKKYIK